MTDEGHHRVSAVLVSYEPDIARLTEALAAAAGQVDRMVVVDNGSTNFDEVAAVCATRANVTLRSLGSNRGIGAALNAGVAFLAPVEWVLTLDQDTVVFDGAVAKVMDAFDELAEPIRRGCAVVALSRGLPAPRGARRRWVERAVVMGERGRFRELRWVITSGNLVRGAALANVQFNEEYFIDLVDVRFCGDLRRAGWTVLQYNEPTMDHRLGRTVELRRGARAYEGGDRLYYIARNGTDVLRRRDLTLREFLRDVVGFSRVYVTVNGVRSIGTCARLTAGGILDGLRGRFGPRR